MTGKHLFELYQKFENSGLRGHPVIQDNELVLLANELQKIVDYFHYSQEHLISFAIRSSKLNSVELTIRARKIR